MSAGRGIRTSNTSPPRSVCSFSRTVELDRDARRDDGLVLTRLTFDILGTIPVDVVETVVRVVRPGRTIELVEAAVTHNGRAAVVLRASPCSPSTPPTCTPPLPIHGNVIIATG